MTETQRQATLSDGQDAEEMLLDIEARIGELAEQEQRAAPTVVRTPTGKHQACSVPSGQPPKHERLGLESKRHLRHATTIHKNPDIVPR